MEEDGLDIKDDHNHNYRASSASKVRTYPGSRLADASAVTPTVCAVRPGGEPGARRLRLGSTGASKLMDSDSGSESSEVSETDSAAPPAAEEGKFTLDSTSKFRKFSKHCS